MLKGKKLLAFALTAVLLATSASPVSAVPCQHKNVTYTSNGDSTHTVHCTVCDTDIETAGACTFENYPNHCDHCNYVTAHTCTGTPDLTQADYGDNCCVNGTAPYTCDLCGENKTDGVAPAFEAHIVDENGACTHCTYQCPHSCVIVEDEIRYVPAEDLKHKAQYTCTDCGAVFELTHDLPTGYNESCEHDTAIMQKDANQHKYVCNVCKRDVLAENHVWNGDAICDICNYECLHTQWHYEHIDGTSQHIKVCSVCGLELEAPETCTKGYEAADNMVHTLLCEVCGFEYVPSEAHEFVEDTCEKCLHKCVHDGAMNYTPQTGLNRHDTFCAICGLQTEENTPCTFESGVCTLCGNTYVCPHDGTFTYTYSVGNKHTKICNECNQVVESNLPCTFEKYINKCDICGHVTEHEHTYASTGTCSKCGAECPHTTTQWVSVGSNHHKQVCLVCGKIIVANESCTFTVSNTKCTKCLTEHTHSYVYSSNNSTNHTIRCSICESTATENHSFKYEYKGIRDKTIYEHYKKCKYCSYTEEQKCEFGSDDRCKYCDHKKSEEEEEKASKSGGTSTHDPYGYAYSGSQYELDYLKQRPVENIARLRELGVALPQNTITTVPATAGANAQLLEMVAVESDARDTANQYMYANYFGTMLGYNKFSPSKTFLVYPTSGVPTNTPLVVAWANTGCKYGDAVYVVWYSWYAHDMRLIPALVNEQNVVVCQIPQITSTSSMTVVKMEKEVMAKTTGTTKTTTGSESISSTDAKNETKTEDKAEDKTVTQAPLTSSSSSKTTTTTTTKVPVTSVDSKTGEVTEITTSGSSTTMKN